MALPSTPSPQTKTFRYTPQVYLHFIPRRFLVHPFYKPIFAHRSTSFHAGPPPPLSFCPSLAGSTLDASSRDGQARPQIYNFAHRDAYNHRIPETVLFIISFGAFATSGWRFSRSRGAIKAPGDYANPANDTAAAPPFGTGGEIRREIRILRAGMPRTFETGRPVFSRRSSAAAA